MVLSFSAQVFWAVAAGDSLFAQYIQALIYLTTVHALTTSSSGISSATPFVQTIISGGKKHLSSR
jgi:hypothetical protein